MMITERKNVGGIMEGLTTLDRLPVGESAEVRLLRASGGIRRRLMDLGFVVGACTVCVGESPLGDPKAFLIDGAVIALRKRDCTSIDILRSDCIDQGKI